MLRPSQSMSHTEHFLLSAYGSKWKEVNLVMFTVFIDDSGTSPNQKLAIAAALIVPASKIRRIESLWASFRAKHDFNYLHAAEIATLHRKGQYEDWSDNKASVVMGRALQIMQANSSAAFLFAVDKDMFDAATPEHWRIQGGLNHYTWALRTLLHQLIEWHAARNIKPPFEWVIDNAVGKDRDEIEMLMAQFDGTFGGAGLFEGHYSFRCKANVPSLQAVDLLAWSGYSLGGNAFFDSPVNRFAEEIRKGLGAC